MKAPRFSSPPKYGVIHCARRPLALRWRLLLLLVLSFLAALLMSGCHHHGENPPVRDVLVTIGVVVLVLVILAVWKTRQNDRWLAEHVAGRAELAEALAACRREDRDIFAALRLPAGPVPIDDQQRILCAIAAESRNIQKHVQRAQELGSLDDQADELALAARKLKGLERCAEALAARIGGEEPETVILETRGGPKA